VLIGLKPSVFIDDQRDPSEAEMEVGRPARVDAEHLHDVEPHRIGQGQVLVRELAQQADSPGMFLDTDGNDLQWVQILDERGELQRAGPIEPSENQPWPSASTSAVVTCEGGSANSLRNTGGRYRTYRGTQSAPTCRRTREAAA